MTTQLPMVRVARQRIIASGEFDINGSNFISRLDAAVHHRIECSSGAFSESGPGYLLNGGLQGHCMREARVTSHNVAKAWPRIPNNRINVPDTIQFDNSSPAYKTVLKIQP